MISFDSVVDTLTGNPGRAIDDHIHDFNSITSGGGGGGKKGGDGTQTITNLPWKPLQGPILDTVGNLANAPTPTFNPAGNPLVAGFSPFQQAGLGLVGGAAGQQANLADLAQQGAQFSLQDMLSPDSNPHLQATADAAVNTVFRNLNENVIPGIEDQAILAGGVGGSEANQAVGRATERSTQQALDTSANIFSNAYQNSLNNYTSTLLGLPGLQQAANTPVNTLLNAGALQQGQRQQLFDARRQEHQFNQQQPFSQQADLLALMLGGPRTQVQPAPPGVSPVQTGLAGAATGATVGGPWGALLGGLLGYGAGAIG